jgi:phosphoesterase RecJ-like protein
MNLLQSDISDRVASPIQRIKDAVAASRRVLVVSHIDPDGDALGTQLAFGQYLKDIGKDVVMVRDSDIPDKYRFLPQVEKIVPSAGLTTALAIDTAIVLECPVLERIGAPARFLTDAVTIINIDHHRDSVPHGNINWIDIHRSSVGEMAYEYFLGVGYNAPVDVATQLYTAILTDTGRFRYESTTPRTMAIAGDLIARGANPRYVCDQVYFNMPPSTMLLTGQVLASMEYHHHGRICVFSMTRQMLEECGAQPSESDGLVDFTLFTRGVTTGALLKEVSDKSTKVSLRSGNGVNVAEVAARYGGGGHFNAAGCEIPMPLAEARQEIIRVLQEADVQA